MISWILRRMRRRCKCCLFGIVLLGALTIYNEILGTMRAATHANHDSRNGGAAIIDREYGELSNSEENNTSQDSQYTGRANLHVFEDLCGTSVANLKKNIHYPIRPHTRTTVHKLAVAPGTTDYGLRIFGYLHPYADGMFEFAVSSSDNSEFWLSSDDSPLNVKLLAWVGTTGTEWTVPGEFTKFSSQTSRPIWLYAAKKYFFEVIHKQDDKGLDHVEVAWKFLNNDTGFHVIESSHITPYMNETAMLNVAQIPQTPASHQSTPTKQLDGSIDMKRKDPRDTFFKVPLVKSMFLRGVLPDCLYKPTYTIKGQTLKRYQGLNYMRLSYIYPNDYTRLSHLENMDSCIYPEKPSLNRDSPQKSSKYYHSRWSQTFSVKHMNFEENRPDGADYKCGIKGNLLLSSSETLPLVQAYMDQLNHKHPGLFTLVRVINVVKRADGDHGSRYLLELEVKDQSNQLLRLAHYIYTSAKPSLINQGKSSASQPTQPPGQPVLCNPVGLEWNPAAMVNIIVTVKGQGRWVHQLISEFERVFRVSGDTNFNLIIVEFDSSEIDVKKTLQEATLPRYQYVKLNGTFRKTIGLQTGIDLIQDKHSIVFICDLHFTIPDSILDNIRKHTVEGHMAFTPVIMRLHCGAAPEDARGFWEVHGFGLLGIYKSDLDAAGGMNTKEFSDHWGGEDWEVMDRILQTGLEVERIYLKNFFHFYHSKRGMWNN